MQLIPQAPVKPCVGRQMNDAADAAVMCETVTGPIMQFAPIKSEDQR